MRVAYLDCYSGISGDMTLGAFLDAGLPLEALRDHLALLPLAGDRLAVEPTTQSGIVGTAAELDDSRFHRLVVEQDLVRGANQIGVAIDGTQRNLSDPYATC